jgi:hypothetical protein
VFVPVVVWIRGRDAQDFCLDLLSCDLVGQAAAERLPAEFLLLDEADGHAEGARRPGRFEYELARGDP